MAGRRSGAAGRGRAGLAAAARGANELVSRIALRLRPADPWSSPVEVTLEPTNRCNSRCLICLPYRRDPAAPQPPSGFLGDETLRRLDPVVRRARRVLLTGCGEPLLHPRFLELARWVKRRGPYLYLFTNGTLLTDELAAGLVREGVDLVSFSLGGATEATARRVRGLPLAAAVDGLARLARARAAAGSALPAIQFNVVAMNSVLPELPGLVELAARHRVSRITMPPLLVHGPETAGESLLANPEAARLLDGAREHARARGIDLVVWDHPPRPKPCTSPWRNLYVAYNGDVLSCAAERYVMGNVLAEAPGRIWRSPRFRGLRRLLRTAPATVCPGCPEWSGRPEDYLRALPHDRRAAGTFDDEGRPRGGPGREEAQGKEPRGRSCTTAS